jgi:sulfite exporter TauE/SafE/copper chaperone CopZ/plastocyanin domain-containing protein
LITKTLKISGMTCVSCENIIERKLQGTKGISDAKVSYVTGNAIITFDEDVISIDGIIKVIEELDYMVIKTPQKITHNKMHEKPDITKILGVGIILYALYMIINRFGGFNIFNAFPQAEAGTGYGMLFVIGLLTSLHCVAMCGGINLSQCVPQQLPAGDSNTRLATLKPSLLYNLGRVISYTVVGGIVGAVGSVVSFSGAAKGIVQLAAGIFMVIMGLNMLNIFPWLKKLNPRMPKIFAKKINDQKSSKSPLYVGLLNGVMPCGPLQAMQLYALSTGSPLAGAVSMFLFSLGTVPLMFGLGALSSLLSKKFTHKMMTVSAVLVVILGISMFSSGATLSGISLPPIGRSSSSSAEDNNVAIVSDGVQTVSTKLSPGTYEAIVVQKGIPVKWVIQASDEDINGCNNEIIIPKFEVEKKLEEGENVIEFTPSESGTYAYSCWMGMIRSTITVIDDINDSDTSAPNTGESKSNYKIPVDEIAIAEMIDGGQIVSIDMTEDGFTPAVVVVQKNIDTLLIINGIDVNDNNKTLLFPKYRAQVNIEPGENPLQLIPDGDFEFTTASSSFYGYVKVVDDIDNIDIEAIKEEVRAFVPEIQDFVDNSGLPSCH